MKNKIKKLISILLLMMILLTYASCEIFTSKPVDEESESDSSDSASEEIVNNIDTDAENIQTDYSENSVTETPVETEYRGPGKDLEISGIIKSSSNLLLKLNIEWSVTQTVDNENATLELKLCIDTYAIMIGARNNGKLVINGEEITFSTDVIKSDSNHNTSIEIYKYSTEIPSPYNEDTIADVSASFYFGGSYGGVSIGWLDVEGSIEFTDNMTEIVETSNPLSPELPDNPYAPVITVY